MTNGIFKPGDQLWPATDSSICKFAASARKMHNAMNDGDVKAALEIEKAGGCSIALSSAMRENVNYTFLSYYDDDLIVLVQQTVSADGTHNTAAVGFSPAADFNLA